MKIYLLPDPQKTTKKKTKVARKTCNPTYNEMVCGEGVGTGQGFVNKVVLEHGHTYSFKYHLWQLSCCEWQIKMARKAMFPVFYMESLLTFRVGVPQLGCSLGPVLWGRGVR